MTRKEMKEWQVRIWEAENQLKNETLDLLKEMIKDLTHDEILKVKGFIVNEYDFITQIDDIKICTIETRIRLDSMSQKDLKSIIDFISLNIWVK
ncbi:MAG: hypothetical protein WCP55_03035 [Lentisphaerota bacterium]